jgi:DNA-binding YbaB/EbfC family protein
MPDLFGLMKQAAELKTKMETLQAELDRIDVEGSAGAGMVVVRMSAKGEVKAIQIDPSLMKPEETGVLQDLLVAAHADARRKAEATMQEKMQGLAGGLPLPPGLKLF